MSNSNKTTIYGKHSIPKDDCRIDLGHACSPETHKKPNKLKILRVSGSGQRLHVFNSIHPRPLQFQYPSSGRENQFARDKEYSVSYGLSHLLYLFLVQCLFLKKVHQIIGKHQDLKPGIVPSIIMRDHLIQPKAVYSLFDEVFTTCPLIIISPNIRCFFITAGSWESCSPLSSA